MTNKLESSYRCVFQYIDENIFKLKPTVFITDYEAAIKKALRIVYPGVKLIGCWFHYCQALRRNTSKKFRHLLLFIRQSKQASRVYHKFMALPLLPDHLIQKAFEQLKLSIYLFDREKKFETFVNYFEKQWLKKVINICIYNENIK